MGEQQARSKRRSSFKNLSSTSSSSHGKSRALARGSSSMVGTRNSPMPSQLSTFQMSEEERSSQLEMLTGPRPKVGNSKAVMILVIMILLCVVGVLVFLLAM